MKRSLSLLPLLLLALALPALASRNTGGTYSLPYPTVQSGTTISTTWANGTLADVKVAMTDSLSRSGWGGMLAPLKVPDGSSAAPSLTWTSDAASGLFLSAQSDVRMSVASTARMIWTATTTTSSNALVCSSTLAVTGTSTLTGAVTAAAGATVTNSTTNGAGVTTTGNGTGAGVVATGGATGNGVTASGGATSGVGVAGTGTGASSGVTGTGGATNGSGVAGAGTGTGHGVTGQGGSTGSSTSTGVGVYGTGGGSGPGVRGVGGASGGDGVVAIGSNSSGRGVNALGGTGQPGGFFTPGTSATTTAVHPSVTLNGGHLLFSGVTAPASTTAVSNTLTPMNIPKSWAQITLNNSATPTVNAAFNVSSVGASSTNLTVTFASGFAAATYACTCTTNSGATICYNSSKASGSVVLHIYKTSTSSDLNVATDLGTGVDVVCVGAQ